MKESKQAPSLEGDRSSLLKKILKWLSHPSWAGLGVIIAIALAVLLPNSNDVNLPDEQNSQPHKKNADEFKNGAQSSINPDYSTINPNVLEKHAVKIPIERLPFAEPVLDEAHYDFNYGCQNIVDKVSHNLGVGETIVLGRCPIVPYGAGETVESLPKEETIMLLRLKALKNSNTVSLNLQYGERCTWDEGTPMSEEEISVEFELTLGQSYDLGSGVWFGTDLEFERISDAGNAIFQVVTSDLCGYGA